MQTISRPHHELHLAAFSHLCSSAFICGYTLGVARIVILGAGFAGLESATVLERELGSTARCEITLVDQDNYFLFTPLLPQIPSSFINPRHIVQPVRDIRGTRNFRFMRDVVRGMDPGSRRVELGSGRLEYDYLVVALGSRRNDFGVPGVGEHTFDFKTLEDAVTLREHVLDLCEHADHTEDATARGRMLTVVVVGGGYTGAELIAELQDFLFRYVVPRYRGIHRTDIQLMLLEATAKLLNNVDPALAAHAQRRLRREGIKLRPNSPVTRCLEGGVEIKGGEIIRAETVVWTAGIRAHELAAELSGPHDRIGRCVVNEYLQLEGHPEIFVAGDCAASTAAPQAAAVVPTAIEQGRLAGRNIARLLRGELLERYVHSPRSMAVTLGMNYAVLSVGPVRIRGLLAWLAANAYHLYKLVGLKKQVQVFLDWSLAYIFPRDASMVRKPRHCKFCEAAKRAGD